MALARVDQITKKKSSGRKRNTSAERRFPHAAPARWSPPRWLIPTLLGIIVIFFSLLRARLVRMPLERDEGEYAYAGQLIVQGIPPYKLVYNMKLPGTYAAYALIFLLFGQSKEAVHIGLMVVNAGTTVLMYFLGRRLFGTVAGVSTAAAFALLSTSPDILGFQGHATHFVILFAVAGMLVFLRAFERSRLVWFLLSGVLFGLAFLMKQPGIFFSIFCLVYLAYAQRNKPGREMLFRSASYAAGVAIPFLLTCLIMLASGVFKTFWFWVVDYARAYTGITTLSEGLTAFQDTFTTIAEAPAGLWMLAVLGLIALVADRSIRKHFFLTASFLVFSFLALCPGLYFRPHYFILLLPAVSLLVGAAVGSSTSQIWEYSRSLKAAAIPSLMLVLACTYAVAVRSEFYFSMDGPTAIHYLYGKNAFFSEAVVIADHIRKTTPESARIAVLGSEPEIYFYAHRHSATGFIYNFALMEHQKFAEQMQQDMFTEIEAARPEILVIDMQLWAIAQSVGIEGRLNWTNEYVKNYKVAGLILDMGNADALVWGEPQQSYLPEAVLFYILQRKTT